MYIHLKGHLANSLSFSYWVPNSSGMLASGCPSYNHFPVKMNPFHGLKATSDLGLMREGNFYKLKGA